MNIYLIKLDASCTVGVVEAYLASAQSMEQAEEMRFWPEIYDIYKQTGYLEIEGEQKLSESRLLGSSAPSLDKDLPFIIETFLHHG